MTFKEEILEVANGEEIESIVIGWFGNSAWKAEDGDRAGNRAISKELHNKPIPWNEIAEKLNYHYDAGYGGADCHSIIAWTKNRVLFVHEYDGSTGVVWVPRHPVKIEPEMSGQYG